MRKDILKTAAVTALLTAAATYMVSPKTTSGIAENTLRRLVAALDHLDNTSAELQQTVTELKAGPHQVSLLAPAAFHVPQPPTDFSSTVAGLAAYIQHQQTEIDRLKAENKRLAPAQRAKNDKPTNRTKTEARPKPSPLLITASTREDEPAPIALPNSPPVDASPAPVIRQTPVIVGPPPKAYRPAPALPAPLAQSVAPAPAAPTPQVEIVPAPVPETAAAPLQIAAAATSAAAPASPGAAAAPPPPIPELAPLPEEEVSSLPTPTEIAEPKAVAAAPELPSKRSWTVNEGETLKSTLARWAREDNPSNPVDVKWKTDFDFVVDRQTTFYEDTFEAAVTKLLIGFASANPRPKAVYYPPTRSLIVNTPDAAQG